MADGPIASTNRGQPLPQDSDWLLAFLPALRSKGERMLEAGCGPGLDAATLAGGGFEVTGIDRAPLDRAMAMAPSARLARADLRYLPFKTGSFDAAVSSLTLHYLPWPETRAAFGELRRVLGHGAPLLFRVNATDDVHHGAGDGEELEPNFYRVREGVRSHAETKRFFDEAMVRAAVEDMFSVQSLAHCTIHRYAMPKQVWECLALAKD